MMDKKELSREDAIFVILLAINNFMFCNDFPSGYLASIYNTFMKKQSGFTTHDVYELLGISREEINVAILRMHDEMFEGVIHGTKEFSLEDLEFVIGSPTPIEGAQDER